MSEDTAGPTGFDPARGMTETDVLRRMMGFVALRSGVPFLKRLEAVARLNASDLLAQCHFPAGATFAVFDEPGEHDPCCLVLPGGAVLSFNHWNDELTDVARAVFVAEACNEALAGQTPTNPEQARAAILREGER